MSSSDPRDTPDPNSLSYYAPPRLRNRAEALQSLRLRPAEQPPISAASIRVDPFLEALPPPSTSESIELAALMRQQTSTDVKFVITICCAGVVIAAGVTTFLSLGHFSGSRKEVLPAEVSGISPSATPQAKMAAMDQLIQRMSIPAFAVEDGDGNINEPLPLGVKVTGHPQGEIVNLNGLPADTKLTTGTASGAGQWRVAVNDLPVTVVIPPRDYVGPMNIVAELPGENGKQALRAAVRLTWTQETPSPGAAEPLQTTPVKASPSSTAATGQAARRIDPKEVVALIKRAEELVLNGDIPAARLLLQRAAEAHDARAAFELAATYDPIVSKQLGRNSPAPDLALARTWYQRARDWGSPVAPKQLEALASVDR